MITAIYLSVKAFYKIAAARVDKPDLSILAVAPKSSLQDEVIPPLSDYRMIIERNLFDTRKFDDNNKLDLVDIEAMKQTDLNPILWGTVVSDNGKAYAVIEETKAKKQRLYRIGDMIQDGAATVKIILREKVVLDVNGADEILEMKVKESPKRRDSPFPKRPSLRSAKKITLRRSQLKDVINSDKLLKQVKIGPHFTNGQPDGLSLTIIKPSSIFRKMGLRHGDIITEIDGRRVDSVEDAIKFYDNIKSASGATLGIKRRGQVKKFEYNIE